MYTLRNLKKYFEITFKMDDWNEICEDKGQKLGSNEKVLMTCMGIGFSNLNKIIL